MKLKYADLLMTIENGDEIFYFSQKVSFHIPEISIDIDEQRKVIIRQTICFGYESSLYFIILKSIDRLILLGSMFYSMLIRNLYYGRATKEIEKFETMSNYMKMMLDDQIDKIVTYCPEIIDFKEKCKDMNKLPSKNI